MNVLIVTAYKDINRGYWNDEWNRPKDTYISWFINMIAIKNQNIVCFCEEDVKNDIIKRLDGTLPSHLKLLDIELNDTLFINYEKEKEIMESAYFINLLKDRREQNRNPEFCKPEYTCITNSKSMFLRRASNMFNNYTHYAWMDFGFIRQTPPINLNWNCLNDNKIHIATFKNILQDENITPIFALQSWDDFVQGGVLFVPKYLIEWLETVYKIQINIHYSLGITDDDQGIMLQIIQKYRNNFTLHISKQWFAMLHVLV
uniref:Uncharacterized protein n=1 Tax=viral metagenome TaxID=1070528 RepID=A0A6C0KUU3_9ZZZZ